MAAALADIASPTQTNASLGPPPPGSGADAVLRSARRRLAAATTTVAYVWFMAVVAVSHPMQDWDGLVAPLALAVCAAVSLRARGANVSRWALVAGIAAAASWELSLGAALTAQILALVATLVAALVLGRREAAFLAIALSLLALALPAAAPLPIAALVASATAVLWVAGADMTQALALAEASEHRAWQHAQEAVRRKGELQATSKALRDMYALLERTNRELEMARREAEEAKEIKARFAANISHELRTPLNLIMGFSRMMYRSPEVYGSVRWTPELRADIREIHSASRHLLGMVDDILDLARVDAQRLPLKLEPTDLASLIDEAAATARGLLRGSPVTLALAVPLALPEVIVDRTRIRQVLLNLLNNAIRYTDTGGIIISAREVDGEVEVAMKDTGVGIATDDLARIFDEFAQATVPITSSRGGAGLGLAVCKQFVQLHGGRITVSSELGAGSTFRFTIPVPGTGRARSRLSYYSPEGWLPPLPEGHGERTVIVLAPDDTSARLLARGLEGYRAIPLSDLSRLAELVEAEHPAGVVIVRGPTARDESPSPAQVWQSAGRDDLGVVEWEVPLEESARRRLEVDGYFTKPVDLDSLVSAIGSRSRPITTAMIVDDNLGFQSLVGRAVASAFPGVSLRYHAGGAEALADLRAGLVDVLVLDLAIPAPDGAALLTQAREEGLLQGTQVLVTTGAAATADLVGLFAPSLRFSKRAMPHGTEWFHGIKALLDAVPPDYSLPRAELAPPIGHPVTPAS